MVSLSRQVLILKAIAEDTRLRLALLLDKAELNVSEIVEILGQSQPRISRHLKTMMDAGVLERYQEGNWVLYRTSQEEDITKVLSPVLSALDCENDHQLNHDLAALATIRKTRAKKANDFFAKHANEWNELKKLNLDERQVEAKMLALVNNQQFDFHLDLGTGTGRMLELFAPQSKDSLGIDISQDMLKVARARLDEDNMRHCRVRQGDILRPPQNEKRADFITIHHVLHFLDEPFSAIENAKRWLAPNGIMMIVDFAPHEYEHLRTDHHHRRLGFSDPQIRQWFEQLKLKTIDNVTLANAGNLNVSIWVAQN